jgi:hypothetical protein
MRDGAPNDDAPGSVPGAWTLIIDRVDSTKYTPRTATQLIPRSSCIARRRRQRDERNRQTEQATEENLEIMFTRRAKCIIRRGILFLHLVL